MITKVEYHDEMLNTNYRTDYIVQSGEVSNFLFPTFYARTIKKIRGNSHQFHGSPRPPYKT